MYMFRSNICMYVIKGFRWEKRRESQLRIHDVKLKICPDNKIYLNEPDNFFFYPKLHIFSLFNMYISYRSIATFYN